jgi:hypothetical protein
MPVSGNTFLSITADTGLASVGHGAISRRDKYWADTDCGRVSHATGSMRTRHISTCNNCRLSRLEKFVASLQVQRLR